MLESVRLNIRPVESTALELLLEQYRRGLKPLKILMNSKKKRFFRFLFFFLFTLALILLCSARINEAVNSKITIQNTDSVTKKQISSELRLISLYWVLN